MAPAITLHIALNKQTIILLSGVSVSLQQGFFFSGNKPLKKEEEKQKQTKKPPTVER